MGSSGERPRLEIIRLATPNETNSTLVHKDIPGAAFAIAVNERVEFEARFTAFAAATTTGIHLSTTGPASPSRVRINAESMAASNTMESRIAAVNVFGNIGTAFASSFMTAAPGHLVKVYGFIINGANAGTIQLRFATEIDTSLVTVEGGGMLLVYRQ